MFVYDVEVDNLSMGLTAIVGVGVVEGMAYLVGSFFWYAADDSRIVQTFNLATGIAYIHTIHAFVQRNAFSDNIR